VDIFIASGAKQYLRPTWVHKSCWGYTPKTCNLNTPSSWTNDQPLALPFLCSSGVPSHTQPPYQQGSSGAPSIQHTSSLPNCSSRVQSLSRAPHIPAHSNRLGREVLVISLRSQPITNNRLLKFCCPGNQASNA